MKSYNGWLFLICKDKMRQKRESNIELMRLVLMFFIVVHHGIVHGLGLAGLSEWGGENFICRQDMLTVSLTNSFLIFAVNAFVLITGYFSLSFKKEKVVWILVSVLLYTFLLSIIPLILQKEYWQAFRNLFLLSYGRYWFIVDYLFLMVLAPVINGGYALLDKKKSYALIGMLLIINCYFGFLWGNNVNENGYTLMQFVLMYIIGRHIRIYQCEYKMKRKGAILMYILLSVINGVLFYVAYNLGNEKLAWKLTYYNNPMVIASAVFFFLAILKTKMNSKAINYLSSSALAIYLIQNTQLVGDNYYHLVTAFYVTNRSIWMSLGLIMLLSLFICIISIFIDKICFPVLKFACHIVNANMVTMISVIRKMSRNL